MAIDFSQVISIQIPNSTYRELEWIYLDSVYSKRTYVDINEHFERGYMYILSTEARKYGDIFAGGSLFGYGSYAARAYISLNYNGVVSAHLGGYPDYGDTTLGTIPITEVVRDYWFKLPSSGRCTAGVNTPLDEGFTPILSSTTVPLNTLNPYYTLCVGGYPSTTDTSSSVYISTARQRVYRFRKFSGDETGTLLKDMVPCQRKSDNVIGLFDIINSVFYPIGGTPESSDAGPVVRENPTWGISGTLTVIKIEDANGVVLWPTSITPVSVDIWEWDSSIQWTVGTGVQNADGYNYYPLTASGGEKGVQIAIADNPEGIPSDGKFPSRAERTWKVKFPEAGWYQMVMTCNYSSSGANQSWTMWKVFGIDGKSKDNNNGSWTYTDPDYNIDILVFKTSHEDEYHTVTYPDIGAQPACAFTDIPNFQEGVMAQIVTCLLYCDDATVEHSITFQDNGYRCVFDTASNIIFRKIPYDPSQYTPNS